MGVLKGAADLVYTFRFIRMMVMKWENWDAYKLGLIDENGKRIKKNRINSPEKRDPWTPYVRLCANIKRLVQKIPGGGTKLGSFASALFLIKENGNLDDHGLEKIIKKVLEWVNYSMEEALMFQNQPLMNMGEKKDQQHHF